MSQTLLFDLLGMLEVSPQRNFAPCTSAPKPFPSAPLDLGAPQDLSAPFERPTGPERPI